MEKARRAAIAALPADRDRLGFEDGYASATAALKERLEKISKALEFYSNRDNYLDEIIGAGEGRDKCGDHARSALATLRGILGEMK